MIDMEIEHWCTEVIAAGRHGVIPAEDEAEALCRRYCDLVATVEGSEGQSVFQALIDSIQSEGEYEGTHNALWRFPPDEFARYMVAALPGLLERLERADPGQAGRFLCPLIGWACEDYVPPFNRELARTPDAQRATILRWITENESEGWFEHAPGLLRPDPLK